MKMLYSEIAKIILIDKILNEGNTGNLKQFAAKVGCKPRTLQNYIDDMNVLLQPNNVCVFYNHKTKTFQYSAKGSLQNVWIWNAA